MKNQSKKLEAFRLSDDVRKILAKIAARTGKTKVRIVEEALLLHGKEIAR